jgi:hypothetical protein
MKQSAIKKILKNLNNIHKAIEVIASLIPLDESSPAPKAKAAKKRGRPVKK